MIFFLTPELLKKSNLFLLLSGLIWVEWQDMCLARTFYYSLLVKKTSLTLLNGLKSYLSRQPEPDPVSISIPPQSSVRVKIIKTFYNLQFSSKMCKFLNFFRQKKPQLRALLKLNYWWMKIFNSFGLIVTKPPVRSCLSEISVSTKYNVKSEAKHVVQWDVRKFDFV